MIQNAEQQIDRRADQDNLGERPVEVIPRWRKAAMTGACTAALLLTSACGGSDSSSGSGSTTTAVTSDTGSASGSTSTTASTGTTTATTSTGTSSSTSSAAASGFSTGSTATTGSTTSSSDTGSSTTGSSTTSSSTSSGTTGSTTSSSTTGSSTSSSSTSSGKIDPANLAGTAHVTFDDEFDSLSLWNGATNTGTWSTNYWYNDEWGGYSTSKGVTLTGNNEQEWYINSNYAATSSIKPWTVSDGVLTLTAQAADSTTQALIGGYKYTSGMINSWHSFSQTYGYFVMRAQLPAGQGLWPAFWLLPEDGSWPPELDIMENLGQDTSNYYTTVHSDTLTNTYESSKVAVSDATAWHTYAVDWEADYTTFYVDGKQVYQVATPSDMNKPMYIIANLAVGGSWPGDVNSTTPFPAQMKIDYIRAYAAGTN